MVAPLRILHLTPYYEDAWGYGGIPRVATGICRALARRGHHVTVCTTDACDAGTRLAAPRGAGRFGPWPAVAGADGAVRVRVFPNLSNRVAYHLQLFTPLGLHGFLARAAAEFDVAHVHGYRHLIGVLGAAALTRAGVPYVAQPNGTAGMIERRLVAKWVFDRALNRGFFPGAARVIAVSRAEAGQLAALGVPAERIRVVPNPIEPEEHVAARAPGEFRRRHGIRFDRYVLYLGKLTPRKRVDTLVRAMGLRRDHAARSGAGEGAADGVGLVIVGNDMGEERRLRELVRELRLDDHVAFCGIVRGAERLAALAEAAVVAYAGSEEIFGLVALEALLCGAPVVVAGDSGCGEIAADLPGAQIVPPGDPVALAAALERVLDDESTWHARARQASPTIHGRYDADVVAQQLEVIYTEARGEAR